MVSAYHIFWYTDEIHLLNEGLILDEHDISYSGDRKRFINPPDFGESSDKYQFMFFLSLFFIDSYETYPQIKKEKSSVITDSNYYGPGVQDEHFIVWMRLAGVPHFRKLYGRIRTPNLKKGDVLKFKIVNNFEVASFKGRKGLALATENFIGGRNYGIGILFIVGSVLSFIFAAGVVIANKICPE